MIVINLKCFRNIIVTWEILPNVLDFQVQNKTRNRLRIWKKKTQNCITKRTWWFSKWSLICRHGVFIHSSWDSLGRGKGGCLGIITSLFTITEHMQKAKMMLWASHGAVWKILAWGVLLWEPPQAACRRQIYDGQLRSRSLLPTCLLHGRHTPSFSLLTPHKIKYQSILDLKDT